MQIMLDYYKNKNKNMAIMKYDDYIKLSKQVQQAKDDAISFIKDFFEKYELGDFILTLEEGFMLQDKYLISNISIKKDKIIIYSSTNTGKEKLFDYSKLEMDKIGSILDEIRNLSVEDVLIDLLFKKKIDNAKKIIEKFNPNISESILRYSNKFPEFFNSYYFQNYYINKYSIDDITKMKLLVKYVIIDKNIKKEYVFFNMNNVGLM